MSVKPDFCCKTYTRKCIQLKPCKSYCLSRAALCCKTTCGSSGVTNAGVTDLSINGQFSSTYQGVQLQTQASCCPYLSIGDTFTIGTTTYVIIQIKAGTIVAVDGAKNMSIETLLDPNRVTSAVALHGIDGHVCSAAFYSGADLVANVLSGAVRADERYVVSQKCANLTCSAQAGTVSCDCDCIAQCDC